MPSYFISILYHFDHYYVSTDPIPTMVRSPEPLEARANVSVSTTDDGYVKLEQSVGDPPYYTPEEIRELIDELTEAAAEAERMLSPGPDE